jgi:L-fuculose-phosphate aldolase
MLSYLEESLQEIGKFLANKGYVVAGDGNISGKLPDASHIEITRSGVNKGQLNSDTDFIVIGVDGKISKNDAEYYERYNVKPSSELALHLEVYKKCPAANFVAHAHPINAIVWSLSGLTELPTHILPEVILACGKIPIAPYARPGTPEMADAIRPFLPECRIIILERHGALVWGETSEEVMWGMDRLEQICTILYMVRQSRFATSLPALEIEALKEMRKKLGPKIL